MMECTPEIGHSQSMCVHSVHKSDYSMKIKDLNEPAPFIRLIALAPLPGDVLMVGDSRQVQQLLRGNGALLLLVLG